METFHILEMPEEIHVLVVERVAGNPIKDLFGLKETSKSMKALGDRRRENPCTFYLKGVQFFYTMNLEEDGLAFMKLAADAGYEHVVESVERIGKLVRSVKWGWSLWHGDRFRAHRAQFIAAFLPSFNSCQCAPLLKQQCYCLWHIDISKDDNMCDLCFWIKEVGLFFRDFGPISMIRDKRKW
ncbi:hypothetical protein N665_0602s0016 [Sinapis alba]|nr:hypothetical protein N665_0602s0016 [Sinapis alba]